VKGTIIADGPSLITASCAGQEPARRADAVGGVQPGGRHHPQRASRQDDVLTRSTSTSTRSTPATPSWARKRSHATSPTSATTSSRSRRPRHPRRCRSRACDAGRQGHPRVRPS
jgi:hypothetical protein